MTTQIATLHAALPESLSPAATPGIGVPGTGPDQPKPASQAAPWVPVRVLGPRHRRRILAHLLALDSSDRVLRFGHAASDAQIERYVQSLDFFGRDELFGVFDRQLVLVGLAHLAMGVVIDETMAGAGDPAAAAESASSPSSNGEFGVSVSSQARGRGLGNQLFAHTVTHARNRGAKRLVIYFDRSNPAMLAITRRWAAALSFDGSQAMATVLLDRATLGTQVEALMEAHAAEIDFQIKLQVQRLDRLWPAMLKKKSRRSGTPHDQGVPPPVSGSNIVHKGSACLPSV
jgi:ribosomal protein S18 acetylase RimI-like enzyme